MTKKEKNSLEKIAGFLVPTAASVAESLQKGIAEVFGISASRLFGEIKTTDDQVMQDMVTFYSTIAQLHQNAFDAVTAGMMSVEEAQEQLGIEKEHQMAQNKVSLLCGQCKQHHVLITFNHGNVTQDGYSAIPCEQCQPTAKPEKMKFQSSSAVSQVIHGGGSIPIGYLFETNNSFGLLESWVVVASGGMDVVINRAYVRNEKPELIYAQCYSCGILCEVPFERISQINSEGTTTCNDCAMKQRLSPTILMGLDGLITVSDPGAPPTHPNCKYTPAYEVDKDGNMYDSSSCTGRKTK